MRKEIMQLWCEALRSNEFEQGRGYLDKANKVCIYGVLCLLAMTSGVCDYNEFTSIGSYDGEKARLPNSVREWAGLPKGPISLLGEFVTLSWMNDNGYTFEELADIIEKNYEVL